MAELARKTRLPKGLKASQEASADGCPDAGDAPQFKSCLRWALLPVFREMLSWIAWLGVPRERGLPVHWLWGERCLWCSGRPMRGP